MTVLSKERMYHVIRAPHITEKATLASEHNQVVFRVAPDATKPEIRTAVETLFGVRVKAGKHDPVQGEEKNLPRASRYPVRLQESDGDAAGRSGDRF